MALDKDSEACNQTISEFYNDYLKEFPHLIKHYLIQFSREILDYFFDSAQNLALILFIYIAFSFCIYCCLIKSKFIRQLGEISNCKNVLFVTSHPDDECMFFGPSIINLTAKPDANVYLLCLSIGNFQNLGRIRKEELFNSCKVLGIPESNIQLINCSLMPDDPTINWNEEVVAHIILNFIEIYSIDTVITFDRYGISNHLNHISTFYAVAYLCLEKQLPKQCTPYALESVSRIRKYSICLDLPMSFFLSCKKYVASMEKRDLIRKAMREHKSQDIWFRRAYMCFSRYIFVNTLKEIDVLELELELELEVR